MLNEITKLKRKHKTWTLLDCAMVLLNRTARYTKEFEELSEIIENLRAKKHILPKIVPAKRGCVYKMQKVDVTKSGSLTLKNQ